VVEEEEGDLTNRRVQMDIMDDAGRISEQPEQELIEQQQFEQQQQEQQQHDRRSVSSSRMPSTKTLRPRLVRTPANKDDVTVVPEPEHPPEEPHTPDVLITELKDPPEVVEGDVDEDSESDIEPEYKQITVETVDVEEDWDTDLEIEGKEHLADMTIFSGVHDFISSILF